MCFISIAILSVVSHTITTFAIPIPSEPDPSDPKSQGLYSLTTQLSYAVTDDNVPFLEATRAVGGLILQ